MEDSSTLQSLTPNHSETAYAIPPPRRRPLRSRTIDALVRILSHCRPQLQMQEPVNEEGGSVTLSEVISTNVLVPHPSEVISTNMLVPHPSEVISTNVLVPHPSEVISTNVLVPHPNIKGSENKVVRETSDGEIKENTSIQDFDVEQATTPKLHQPELVREAEQKLFSSNEISVEDYLVTQDQVVDCAVQNTKELEPVNSVLDIQMDEFGTLNDVGLDNDSCFQHLNEAFDSCFGSDMIVESSEARQLSQDKGTVLEENVHKDVAYELHMKEMELEKLLNGSGDTEVPFCQNDGEIEEGEISGDEGVADESFDALSEGAALGEETTENLLASEGNFDSDKLHCEDKDRGHQQHGISDPSPVNKVKSSTPVRELKCYHSLDVLRGSPTDSPKSSDRDCLGKRTLPGRILQANAAENQIDMTPDEEEKASNKKRKRSMTKERRDKKKKKERIKRAEKNRELGVKRLKLPTVVMPKKIVYCRHYLQGRCHEGEKCKFSHDTVPLTKSKPCRYLACNTCMKGDNCPYDHDLSKYPCDNYTLNGFCNRGSECMFSHETPAKSVSVTPNVSKHDLTPQQTVPANGGSYPISKVNKSDLKSPSPQQTSSSRRPMDSCGTSHQNANSRLCSAANSPMQREQAMKHVPRTGGQAPRGVTFLLNGAAPLGNTEKDKQDRSSAKITDGVGAGCKGTLKGPGGISELNERSEGVARRIPRGINFLSFGKPPSDNSSSKILSDLLSNCNDGTGKSDTDDIGKGKLICSLAQGIGNPNGNRQMNQSAINLLSDVTEKANEMSLTVPQNVNFLSFNRSHLDVSAYKEKNNLDSTQASKDGTALSPVKERQSTSKLHDTTGAPSPSLGGPWHQSTSAWNANLSSSFKKNTSSLVQKAVQSTLAFAAQLEPDIKVGSSHCQREN